MKIQKQEINKRVAPLPPWDRRRTRWKNKFDRAYASIRLKAAIYCLEPILVEFPKMEDDIIRNDFDPSAIREMSNYIQKISSILDE